jgi:hypothetical protein
MTPGLEGVMGRSSKHPGVLVAIVALLMGTFTLGCATRLRAPKEESLKARIPKGHGLAVGRVKWEEKVPEFLSDKANTKGGTRQRIQLHVRNKTTGRRFTYRTEKDGEFYLLLPIGDYVITRIVALDGEIRSQKGRGWPFVLLEGYPIYVGTYFITGRWPNIAAAPRNEYDDMVRRLRAGYPSLDKEMLPIGGSYLDQLEKISPHQIQDWKNPD